MKPSSRVSSSRAAEASGRRIKLTALLVVAFLLRIGFAFAMGELGHTPPGDYREYVTAATRLLEYGAISSPIVFEGRIAEPSYLLPPVYTVVVAAVYRAFGVETNVATLALQLLNAAASTLVVLLVFRIAYALGGRRAAWIAAVVAAFNPLLFGLTGWVWDMYLVTLGATFAIWWALRLGGRELRSWPMFAFGAYLGLLALLNPAFTSTYPLLVLWPCVRNRASWPRIAGVAGLALVGWALAIAPWTIRNYLHFGELVYVRGGLGMELWLGSSPEAETNPGGIHDAYYPLKSARAQQHVNEIGEAALIREYSRAGRAAVAGDPVRFLRLCALRVADFWLGTTRTHANPPRLSWWPAQPQRLALSIFLLVETLLTIAAALLFRNRAAVVWLFLLAVAFSFVYCLTHFELRYRVPIEPVLAVTIGLIGGASTNRNAAREAACS